jgi:hypothetical protein
MSIPVSSLIVKLGGLYHREKEQAKGNRKTGNGNYLAFMDNI